MRQLDTPATTHPHPCPHYGLYGGTAYSCTGLAAVTIADTGNFLTKRVIVYDVATGRIVRELCSVRDLLALGDAALPRAAQESIALAMEQRLDTPADDPDDEWQRMQARNRLSTVTSVAFTHDDAFLLVGDAAHKRVYVFCVATGEYKRYIDVAAALVSGLGDDDDDYCCNDDARFFDDGESAVRTAAMFAADKAVRAGADAAAALDMAARYAQTFGVPALQDDVVATQVRLALADEERVTVQARFVARLFTRPCSMACTRDFVAILPDGNLPCVFLLDIDTGHFITALYVAP
jgi:hypothetical protein